MTREEAIEWTSLEIVESLEKLSCEPTSRAYTHKEGEIEWVASMPIPYDTLPTAKQDNLPIGGSSIFALYYTKAEDKDLVENNGGDWGLVDWKVDHYEIW